MNAKLSLPQLSLLAAIVGGTVGCASTPVPSDRVASTTAAVRAAEEVGASGNPSAALHLKLAKDQLEQARTLINDNDNRRATMVLLRAEADAEVAVALAKEANLRGEAQQALDQVQQLKQRSL